MEWPKILPVLALALLALGALAIVAGPRLFAQDGASAPIYLDLRNRALTASAEELGVSLPAAGAPYGVIMDWHVGHGTATLVAFDTGHTSLYLSSGGGFIGGSEIKGANEAARRMVGHAAEVAHDLRPATEFPLPARGEVRFYLRTRSGVLSAEATEAALDDGRHRLAPLFAAGQDVITAFRQAQ